MAEFLLWPLTFSFEFRFKFYYLLSKNHEVIPMNDLDAFQFSGGDFHRIKSGDATGEFGSVEITNPHDFPGSECAFATGNAGWQQTAAAFTEGFLCAGVDEQRAFGVMKK